MFTCVVSQHPRVLRVGSEHEAGAGGLGYERGQDAPVQLEGPLCPQLLEGLPHREAVDDLPEHGLVEGESHANVDGGRTPSRHVLSPLTGRLEMEAGGSLVLIRFHSGVVVAAAQVSPIMVRHLETAAAASAVSPSHFIRE